MTINELIDCVQHLENTPDAAKVDQIAEVRKVSLNSCVGLELFLSSKMLLGHTFGTVSSHEVKR